MTTATRTQDETLTAIHAAVGHAYAQCGRLNVPLRDRADVAQDAAVEVLRFGGGMASLHARRVVVDYLRRFLGRNGCRAQTVECGAWIPDPHQLDVRAIDLHRMAERLKGRDRVIFELRIRGYELAEIGREIGIGAPAVCRRLRLIEQELRA